MGYQRRVHGQNKNSKKIQINKSKMGSTMSTLKSNHQVMLGASAAIIAVITMYSLAARKKEEVEEVDSTILVFPDGGENYSKTGGLEPNAVTIRIQSDMSLVLLKNSIAKALEIGVYEAQKIRLW